LPSFRIATTGGLDMIVGRIRLFAVAVAAVACAVFVPWAPAFADAGTSVPSAQTDALRADLDALNARLDVLKARLDALLAAPPQAPPGGSLPGGWESTQWGPLGAADRDLVIKVRQAGLWEMPAGEMAQSRAASPRVKEVGRMIRDQHADLDRQTQEVAAKLKVPLPDTPSDQQQAWLDQAYANLLRAAHGKVFAVIAGVRAGTRNELVRTFAEVGNGFVMNHMKYLESTLFVDYQALPAPPDPPRSMPGAPAVAGVDPSIIWLVLGLATVAGAATTIRVIRPR
jgi:predicted outer membrane protein